MTISDAAESAPGAVAARQLGLAHEVISYGRVGSVAEAAAARGVDVADVVKTLVVRMPPEEYVLVLVPGDRSLAWPKLRAVLGSNRCALPDAATALSVTGYERGTITPLGLNLSVIADERIRGRRITLGSGRHGVAIGLAADDLIAAFDCTVADVTADGQRAGAEGADPS